MRSGPFPEIPPGSPPGGSAFLDSSSDIRVYFAPGRSLFSSPECRLQCHSARAPARLPPIRKRLPVAVFRCQQQVRYTQSPIVQLAKQSSQRVLIVFIPFRRDLVEVFIEDALADIVLDA